YQAGQSLLYSMSEDLEETLSGNCLRLRRQPGNLPTEPPGVLCSVTEASGQYQARFTFAGSNQLNDGDFTASVEPSGVSDVAGNPLNPPSPVGFFVLTGDANHDRR